MKKKNTRDKTIGPRVLASLSETPQTTAELKERGFPSHIGGVLARLREEGKVRQDRKGAPWRIHGPAVSPLREEDVPAGAETPRAPKPRGSRVASNGGGLGRQHPLVGPLYEQRDRLDRAIAVLEGRA